MSTNGESEDKGRSRFGKENQVFTVLDRLSFKCQLKARVEESCMQADNSGVYRSPGWR